MPTVVDRTVVESEKGPGSHERLAGIERQIDLLDTTLDLESLVRAEVPVVDLVWLVASTEAVTPNPGPLDATKETGGFALILDVEEREVLIRRTPTRAGVDRQLGRAEKLGALESVRLRRVLVMGDTTASGVHDWGANRRERRKRDIGRKHARQVRDQPTARVGKRHPIDDGVVARVP